MLHRVNILFLKLMNMFFCSLSSQKLLWGAEHGGTTFWPFIASLALSQQLNFLKMQQCPSAGPATAPWYIHRSNSGPDLIYLWSCCKFEFWYKFDENMLVWENWNQVTPWLLCYYQRVRQGYRMSPSKDTKWKLTPLQPEPTEKFDNLSPKMSGKFPASKNN